MTSVLRAIWNGTATRSQEQALFALGGLLILVHTIDDTRAAGELELAPTLINAIALVTAALYPYLPSVVIVVVAFFVGITRLAGGIGHMISLADPSPGDYTGVFEALGALCALLVGVGVIRRRQMSRTSRPS